MRIILLSVLLLSFLACKPPKEEPMAPAVDKTKPQRLSQTSDYSTFDKSVPDACTLLDVDFIAKTFNIDASTITVKDGSSDKNRKARSCFFKWKTDFPNSGILIQALKNPVEEEFPEWVTYFVKTKKTDGEKSFSSPGEVYKYTDWDIVGDEGAASPEIGKYIWRVGNEMAFMLAFNLDIDEAAQRAAADLLAVEVMKNL